MSSQTSGPTLVVLFTSAGRRVELMRCFRRDASQLGIAIRILATDLDPSWSAACSEADESFRVSASTSPLFIPDMLELCQRQSVNLIIPTIDTDLPALSGSRGLFERIGATVSVSAPDVVATARDKFATAEYCESLGVTVPRTVRASTIVDDLSSWKGGMILKPVSGSSSVGVRRVTNERDLRNALSEIAVDDYIAQELVVGDEYTVNMFFDSTGEPRAVVPHRRYEARSGEVSKGVTMRHEGLERVGWALGRQLSGARGALCFQAVVDDGGTPRVFEINARFGGGFPLAHRSGAPFSAWLLEETAGRTPSYHNGWREGVRMLRYDDAFFENE